jgi:hypothetical protein
MELFLVWLSGCLAEGLILGYLGGLPPGLRSSLVIGFCVCFLLGLMEGFALGLVGGGG